MLRRIRARDWPPGSVIPNEADLAVEFGCARATWDLDRAITRVRLCYAPGYSIRTMLGGGSGTG